MNIAKQYQRLKIKNPKRVTANVKLETIINNTPESPGRIFWKGFKKNKLAVCGTIIITALFIIAIFAPVIAPYDQDAINTKEILTPPSKIHLMGTDELGRDVLTRIIWGSRVSLLVGFVAVGIATIIGIPLGALAGYYGRSADGLIMRFVDVMLCFPTFFLILAVIAFWEPSIWKIMLVIGLTSWMGVRPAGASRILILERKRFYPSRSRFRRKRRSNYFSTYPPQQLSPGIG